MALLRPRLVPDAGTPEWWLERLNMQLWARQPDMELMDSYYLSEPPLPFVTRAHQAKMHNEFRKLLEDSRSNFMSLVVDAVEERLRVEGFRLSAANDQAADQATWDIWQANCLDSESQTAFLESLVKGVSYLSVWFPEDGGYPSICVEDPLQTIVAYVPGTNYRQRAAALKVWQDEWTGRDRANLYLPEGIYKFEASGTRNGPISGSPAAQARQAEAKEQSWKRLEEGFFVANPIGVVPIVPLRNRPRLLLEGESEIANVYRIQDQINGFLFLLALAGYFGAHRQRWAAGLEIMLDDKGKPTVDIAVDRLITAPDPNTKFGDFAQTDMSGYLAAIDQKVRHIATTSRTPRHYLEESGQSPSGDAINSAESGLVKKVERKQRTFGESLEETLALARLFGGETDAPVDSEIVWSDPSTPTVAQVTDAVLKEYLAGILPWGKAMERLGYSQTEIAQMLTMFGGTPPSPQTTVSSNPLAGDTTV